MSVGWATWEDDDLGQLLARADGALYEAKAAGRDCVRPHADSRTMTFGAAGPVAGGMSLSSRTLLTPPPSPRRSSRPPPPMPPRASPPSPPPVTSSSCTATPVPGVTGIHKVTGLAAGERIVGLDRAPVGRAARPDLGRQHRLGRPRHGQGDAEVPRARHDRRRRRTPPVTFAVAPDGASARIITPGRDVVVNLATGAATNGPGLTFAAGDPHAGAQAAPSLDYAADGRLIGVDAGQNAYAVQTAAGAATLQTLAAVPFPTIEPLRSTVASDGSVWTASNLSDKPDRARAVALRPLRPGHGQGPRSRAPSSAPPRRPDR